MGGGKEEVSQGTFMGDRNMDEKFQIILIVIIFITIIIVCYDLEVSLLSKFVC